MFYLNILKHVFGPIFLWVLAVSIFLSFYFNIFCLFSSLKVFRHLVSNFIKLFIKGLHSVSYLIYCGVFLASVILIPNVLLGPFLYFIVLC